MSAARSPHVVVVGWGPLVQEKLFEPLGKRSQIRFSWVAHPSYTTTSWPRRPIPENLHFFRASREHEMPPADRALLELLERADVPTVHNMILGDRVVSKLPYDSALSYATYLARRLKELYTSMQPDAVIVGFDAIHSGLAFAVAKQMEIPAFAMHFSVIPPGFACFCDRMSPAARVVLHTKRTLDTQSIAELALEQFERRKMKAHAYIAPPPVPLARAIGHIPQKLAAIHRTVLKSRQREFLQFTEPRSAYSLRAALALLRRAGTARTDLSKVEALSERPSTPYVFFGLHMQPESSIDVWAPFFSNQMWVIETISRSVPPTHKVLVKIHKSDVANYTREALEKMKSFPGVELVRPFADTRTFIEGADLVIAIQGTIGLEAALLGRPVIMLGDSPLDVFPNASQIGAVTNLPYLIQKMLKAPRPARSEILEAYTSYLSPFLPASLNDWSAAIASEEVENYVALFDELAEHLAHQNSEGRRITTVRR